MAKQKVTFEQALETLERIVAEIEEGKVPLEESIERYAEGIKLVGKCREILDAAEKKIQILARDEQGGLTPAGELDDSADAQDADDGEQA